MITPTHYMLLSAALFIIGVIGVMVRRNIIIIFMSLELMLNAANLSLVAFSRYRVGADGLPNYNAQVFVFFIITVAAAEVAVGLEEQGLSANPSPASRRLRREFDRHTRGNSVLMRGDRCHRL
jgi:NADH-quinone oxidoreductase subunit K